MNVRIRLCGLENVGGDVYAAKTIIYVYALTKRKMGDMTVLKEGL